MVLNNMNNVAGNYGRRGFMKILGSIGMGLGLSSFSFTADRRNEISDSSWLTFGEAKQFFFDNLIIESAQNITRKVHKPVKDTNSPVIKKDKPWEHVTYFTVSSWQVIRDPEDGIFKCWYEDWKVKKTIQKDQKPHDLDSAPSRYLYAQSKDGINWEKPELGIVYENGENTNIVYGNDEFGAVHSGWVFLDPLEKQRQHRYKMFFRHFALDEHDERTNYYRLASSPDGIQWNLWEKAPVMGWHGKPGLGDVITISVDQHALIYRINTRKPGYRGFTTLPYDPYPEPFRNPVNPVYPHDLSRENRRRVFRAESSDLIHWSDLRPLIVPDSHLDNIDDAFYGMTQMPIGDAWLGFLHVFHMAENTMDVQLLYSRDGVYFQRIQPGQPWLETGEPGSWDEFMVNIYGTPVVVEDELYVYYGGAKNHHDYWIWGNRQNLEHPEAYDLNRVNYALGLVRMKLDRFVSLTAFSVREGIWVTRPFRSEGNQLIINSKCHKGGYIKVAVANGEGKVLEGYEAENCKEFTGDSVTHKITWNNKDKIPTGQEYIKLHFYMKNADLFSFQLKK